MLWLWKMLFICCILLMNSLLGVAQDVTIEPSAAPITMVPSFGPTARPTAVPSMSPTTTVPSASPTVIPTTIVPTPIPSVTPTVIPTVAPTTTAPTAIPTVKPTSRPTTNPTVHPTNSPTESPTFVPTFTPTWAPSQTPTWAPSAVPTISPTHVPSQTPTWSPSAVPTIVPTAVPSQTPTWSPSESPTVVPTAVPSQTPTWSPSAVPTIVPTAVPSQTPTWSPSEAPTVAPTAVPSQTPTWSPSEAPTAAPTAVPSETPTVTPSETPTIIPTAVPTEVPTTVPTWEPTAGPTPMPTTTMPSPIPTHLPTGRPSTQPSSFPTMSPSSRPSASPSSRPTCKPSTDPTSRPSDGPTSVPSDAPSSIPTLRPTGKPSSLPTNKPSGQPSDCPSSSPSCSPTSHPTSIPSVQPTGQPTLAPNTEPSSQPTVLPTSVPSRQPTGHPSTTPSSLPSGQPTSIPTSSRPTSQPSSHPSVQPTSYPSTCPSDRPTSCPTTGPSSSPSTCPSDRPTSCPTSGPSSAPSTCPSDRPSSCPTSGPTSIPSTCPSDRPTLSPTSAPSAQPSSHPSASPTGQPTGFPSSQPSVLPSCQPSSIPSSTPSSIPSSMPSCQPSVQPSGLPSSLPSSRPSCQPSSQPSELPSSHPSRQPSCQPSSQPSRAPSSQPTSHPTTRDTPRYFSCESLVPCEVNQNNFCQFTTGFIYLMCHNATSPCVVETINFSVGPQTYFEVVGGCALTVRAKGKVIIYQNTTMKGSDIQLEAGGSMTIIGQVITDGGGPLKGPGAPPSSNQLTASSAFVASGGSYGGSGGKAEDCDSSYFSLTDDQIGHVSVLPDINLPYDINPTYGSGGGVPGAGYGGGRIILNTTASLRLSHQAMLSACGTNSSVPEGGAGSGGSILIISHMFYNYGAVMRVNGGHALGEQGAGGGGRVAILVNNTQQSLTSIFQNLSTVNLDGGPQFLSDHTVVVNTCNVGAAGTMFIENGGLNPMDYITESSNSFLLTFNKGNQPYAGTVLNNIPSSTIKVLAQNYSTVMTAGISLKSLSSCVKFSASTTDERCSGLQIHLYSNLICYNQTTNNNATILLNDTSACAVMADVVTIRSFSEMTVSPNVEKIYSVSCFFFLSEDSEFHYSGSAMINTTYNATIYGLVRLSHHAQQYSFNANPKVIIGSGNMVVLNQVMADKLYVHAKTIQLVESGQLRPFGNETTTCLVEMLSTTSACGDFNFTSIATTVTLRASEDILIYSNSVVHSSTVFMCAPNVTIGDGSFVKTDGLGCPANSGIGPGMSSIGGSGGGSYGGSGGKGAGNNAGGGLAYYKDYYLFSGSGGGCASSNLPDGSCDYNAVGGGVISIEASAQLTLLGNITSNGKDGNLTAGGGAGGSISIFAAAFDGKGFVIAMGGSGGVGGSGTLQNNFGGGGGGGYIEIYNQYNSNGKYNTYKFQGPIVATGGSAGGPTATSGTSGIIELPSCSPGYGNNPEIGAICTICPVGYYSYGTNGPCLQCKNAPHHSFYTEEGTETSDCAYACENGYSTKQCYNQFQKFIYSTLGLGGVAGCAIGIIAIILIPMLYFRFKKKYGWGEMKNKDTTDFFKRAILFDMGLGDDVRTNQIDRKHSYASDTENPIHSNNYSISEDVTSIKIRSLGAKVGDELRREHRMADQDMIFHACRVNLSGTNHPSYYKGGPWRIATSRPNCLRPMLHRKEFEEFAEAINKLVSWDQFSYEMLIFYLVFFFVPPLSALVMRALRHKRTNLLLKFIANYDYRCFRCPEQRRKRNSLRIGISPDSTLAYIDFLFDEEHFHKQARPLCRLGQTKLPASFRLAGLGTYFSPYFVDTNDLVLQAVPQTDVTSAFIDEAWISFVVEFNTILRTIHHDSLYPGVRSVIKFLSEEKHTHRLGGLLVEFCTFDNHVSLEQYQTSKGDYEDDEDSSTSSDITGDSNRRKKKNHNNNGSATSQADRDSFIEESRLEKGFRQTSVADNWFLNLGDVVLGSRRQRIESKNSTNKERMYEMRSTESGSRRGAAGADGLSTSQHAAEDLEEDDVSNTRPTDVPDSDRPSSASSTPTWSFFNCTACYRSVVSLWQTLRRKLYNLFFGEPNAAINMNVLTFVETVRAIESGKLSMGIVVSHPKIFEDVYVITEEDYPDEEEDDLDPQQHHSDAHSDTVSNSDNEHQHHKAGHNKRASHRLRSHDFRSKRGSKRDPNSKSSENIASMEKAYGSKTAEISKFYKIMQAAEQNMQGGSEGDAPPSIEKTPSMEIPSTSYSSSKSLRLVKSPSSSSLGGISPVKISQSPFLKMESIYKEEEVPTYDHRDTEDAGPAAGFGRTMSTSSNVSMVSLSDEIKRMSRMKHTATSDASEGEYVEFNRAEGNSRPVSSNLNKFTLHSLGRGSIYNPDEHSSHSGSSSEEAHEYGGDDYGRHGLDNDGFMHDDSTHNADRNDFLSDDDDDDDTPAGQLPPSRMQSTVESRQVSTASAANDHVSGVHNNPNKLTQSLIRDLAQVTTEGYYPPVNIQAKKSPKRKKKKVFRSRSIILNHNLAPSCYQQTVRTWRLQESAIDPVSDGKLGPLHARNGASEDKARKLEGTAENALHHHSNTNMIVDDDIEARKSEFARPSERESMAAGGARDSMMMRMRDSMFPIHLLRISFGGKNAPKPTVDDDAMSQMGKDDANNNGKGMIGVLNPAVMLSNLMERGEAATGTWEKITRFCTYLYNNRFFLFQIREFMFGGNAYPYGPSYIRQLYELVIVLLCMSDITLWIIILFNTYCASDNTTACTNHNALYLVVTVWPLAFVIAPIMGIAAILLGPSATLSRVYALFSRLAAINNGTMIFIMVKYISYFNNNHVTGSIYTVIAVTSSRLIQCFFVDFYIAHIERMRYTRGWDGLNTTLFKTKDNKQEVIG